VLATPDLPASLPSPGGLVRTLALLGLVVLVVLLLSHGGLLRARRSAISGQRG
jgi:hypothetical protein